YWLRGNKRESDNKLQICRIKKNESILSAISFLVLFVLIYFILFRYTDSPVPIGDSFTTALSIVATWMLARKILEQWLLWIVINAVSLGLYIYKGLYPTSILFVFYTILAIVGYYKWKSEFNKQSNCD
ncbi:MAG: nicotinamide riboside transporter PnuC, partial [Marinilabiliales bacterium]